MSNRNMHIVTRRAPGSAITDRTVKFIMSTEEFDRAGDSVALEGWVLDNYQRNPIVLWSHDYEKPPIGKCVQIGIEGRNLAGYVQFATADVNPFADTIFKLVEGGFINAGSVGFKPLDAPRINDRGGLDFTRQELLEFSIVGVPCHPAALAQIKAAKIVSLDDAADALVIEQTPQDGRAAYLEYARKNAARSLGTFKRAHDMRTREFQHGRR